MNAKKPIPIWQVAVALCAAIGVAAGVLFTMNPSVDREELIRKRMKPGTAVAAAQPDPSHYGMARGTPIIPTTGNQRVDPRSKPRGR